MSSVESATPTATARRIFERLNDRDASVLLPFATDDVAEVWPVVGPLNGNKAVRDHFAAIFAALPDFHIDAERMASEGETVFVHWHMTGTFTGAPFLGIEATGRSIDLRGTDCITIRDEKVAANFIAYDGMGFAVQAGILPPHGSRMDHAMTVAVNWMTRVRKRLPR
jgi:predicted ester cyclase